MLKVQAPSDCGNAPKKQLILDFNIAFAKGDIDAIICYLSDDIVWEMIGDKTTIGLADVKTLLEEMSTYKADELALSQIITHGKDASARGILHFENETIAFADFYEFTSAGSSKMKRLISYAKTI